MSAPPIPPNKIPMQMVITLFGKAGTGPERNMHTMKKMVPAWTSFLKSFFYSGMKLRTNDVRE
jgi:hypothetical protein